MIRKLLLAALLMTSGPALAGTLVLKSARVFDGVDPQPHEGWTVVVEGDRIAAAGPADYAPSDAQVVDLPGTTLMPGMIEGHSHLFLLGRSGSPRTAGAADGARGGSCRKDARCGFHDRA